MPALASSRCPPLWPVLGLLAAALLGVYAFVDFAFFGSNPIAHLPYPYVTADHVSYGLGVWRTFYAGNVLTVHYIYPLLWGWALVGTLALWPLRGRDAARMMWLGYVLTLAFLLLAGAFWLPYAAGDHNVVLGTNGDLPRHLAASWYLEAEACTRWSEGVGGGCAAWHESRVFNPVPLGLLGLTLAPLLGLVVSVWQWRRERRPATPPASA